MRILKGFSENLLPLNKTKRKRERKRERGKEGRKGREVEGGREREKKVE